MPSHGKEACLHVSVTQLGAECAHTQPPLLLWEWLLEAPYGMGCIQTAFTRLVKGHAQGRDKWQGISLIPSQDELTPALTVPDKGSDMGIVQICKANTRQRTHLMPVKPQNWLPLKLHLCVCTDTVKQITDPPSPHPLGPVLSPPKGQDECLGQRWVLSLLVDKVKTSTVVCAKDQANEYPTAQ